MLSIYGRIQCLKINIKKVKQYKANRASRGGVKFNKVSNAGFIQVLQDKIQGLFQDFSRTTKIFFKYFYAQMTLLIFNVLTCGVGLYLSFCNQFSLKMHFPIVI